MSKIINENQQIKFRVVCSGNVLLETVSRSVAEQFVSTLTESTQKNVQIVPLTNSGAQVLLG